jgi:hypothetical protein
MPSPWPPPPEVTKLPLPEVVASDPKAEAKKALYQVQLDMIKALYQAQLDIIKAEHLAVLAAEKAELDARIESDKLESTANIERYKSDLINEYAQAQAVNGAYLDAAKSALASSTGKANFVQTAATAISGAYIGVLGIGFAVAQGRNFPVRGIAPTVFLGLAIFLAAAYVSFITRPDDVPVLKRCRKVLPGS